MPLLQQRDAITSCAWWSFLGGLGCMGVSYGLTFIVPNDDKVITALELLSGWPRVGVLIGFMLNGAAMGLFLCAIPLMEMLYAGKKGKE